MVGDTSQMLNSSVINNPGEEMTSLRQNNSVHEPDRGFDSDTEIVTMDRDVEDPHS